MESFRPDVDLPSAKVEAIGHLVEAFRLLGAALLETNIAEGVTASDRELSTGPKIRADDLRNLGNAEKYFELALAECLKNQMTFSFDERPDRELLIQCMLDLKKDIATSYVHALAEVVNSRSARRETSAGDRNAGPLEQTVIENLIEWPVTPLAGSALNAALTMYAWYLGRPHSPLNVDAIENTAGDDMDGTVQTLSENDSDISSENKIEQSTPAASIENLIKLHDAHRNYGEILHEFWKESEAHSTTAKTLLQLYDSTTKALRQRIGELLSNPEAYEESNRNRLNSLLTQSEEMTVQALQGKQDGQDGQ